jgi:dimeric dUTPase (all-alpha-NTP-PPase superfamily)
VDKLDVIFDLQKALDQDIATRRHLEFSREEWVQKDALAIMAELGELIDEVNFKWWKNPKPIDEAAVKEELIDILHFFVSMCLRMGMDAQEMFEIYAGKNRENFDRQYGRSEKKGYEVAE